MPGGAREGRAGRAVALRGTLAVLVLAGLWLVAVESWRIRWPGMLAAFLLVGWPLAVMAWRPRLPGGLRTTLGLAAGLVVIDLSLDLWLDLPPPRALAWTRWELARIAILVALSPLAERLEARAAGQALLRRGLLGLRVATAAPVVLFVGLVLFVALHGTRDQAGRADAALVLGYALDPAGRPQPSLIARVEHAAELQRRGLVGHIVVSGGAARAGVTEAEVMRELLIARGVPPELIHLEDRARSTEENFACARPILARLRARRVLLVTEPWHMPRAELQSRRHLALADLDPGAPPLVYLPSPASSPIWRAARTRAARLHSEAIAYLYERLYAITRPPGRCMDRPT